MSDVMIPLMEDFYSLQGEGFYSGRAAYFIRYAGCDVGCVWCDVKESWDKEAHPEVELNTLIQRVKDSGTDFVVITGGEPAMYDLTAITEALHAENIEIAIETSGAYKIVGNFDWICLSPKKFKMPIEENYAIATELKMIIFNKSDFKWAEELQAKVSDKCILYMQPEWDKSKEMLPLMVDYVKEHVEWNVSLQTHKFLNIP
jgi:7-carboxy-7-deazaguanine synthase